MKSASASFFSHSLRPRWCWPNAPPIFSARSMSAAPDRATAARRIPRASRNVIRELQRRGCTIPQPPSASKLHNVISGAFAKPGQTDWAVLCSLKGVSTILVFWNTSEKNPAEIATMEDRTFLQGISPERIAYSRAISTVGKDFIMRHYNAYGGSMSPPIDHQGVDDAFLEKASVTWYFYDKWLKLTGAD